MCVVCGCLFPWEKETKATWLVFLWVRKEEWRRRREDGKRIEKKRKKGGGSRFGNPKELDGWVVNGGQVVSSMEQRRRKRNESTR